jgi:hypothetical protein
MQLTYALSVGINDQEIPGWDWEKIETYRDPPRHEHESDVPCIGYRIAVGGSGEIGLPRLTPFPIKDFALQKQFAASAARAWKRWSQFAAWCGMHGIDLPAAAVWLVECEVA